jgi:hypothetical protein
VGQPPWARYTQGPTWCLVSVLAHACMHNAASSVRRERGKGNIHIDLYARASTKNKAHLQHPDQHHLPRDLLVHTTEVAIYPVGGMPTAHSQAPSFHLSDTSAHRHNCIFGTSDSRHCGQRRYLHSGIIVIVLLINSW